MFLYNIDDLQATVRENLARRASEVARAEAIVAEEVGKFGAWLRSRGAIPTVVALRQRFEAIRRAELERLDFKLAALPPEARARVDEITRLIVEKLLLTPTEQLKATRRRTRRVGAYARSAHAAVRPAPSADAEQEPADADRATSSTPASSGTVASSRSARSRDRRIVADTSRAAARHARQPARAVAGQRRRRASSRKPAARPCRIVVIKTSGDRLQDAPLSEVGGKRLFVKEIEDALLADEIDLAVHSSKDMPAVLPDGLAIGAVLPREDPRDAVVLPRDATAGRPVDDR